MIVLMKFVTARGLHTFARELRRLQNVGQVSWLRECFSSQWRDRAGVTPASLFSPQLGAPRRLVKDRRNARTLTRAAVESQTDRSIDHIGRILCFLWLRVRCLAMIKTVEWTKDGVCMLDQRLLPSEEKYLMLRSYDEVAEAIRKMVIRGAPAIGVAAAMGIALGASQSVGTSVADLDDDLQYICGVMSKTRPTAVNLFWAIERMRTAFQKNKHLNDVEEIKKALVAEALAIFEEDIAANRAIGKHGGPLIPDGATVLTHCNAGALATAGDYGTALGVIRGARDAGKRVAVIADETRPFLQGLRLTAWELQKDDIPVTVITDNMAGPGMKGGKGDAVGVGGGR